MNNDLMIFDLARPWSRREYLSLLDLAGESSQFLLVKRHASLEDTLDISSRLRPFLIHEYSGDCWPGTRLLGGCTAEIFKYAATSEALILLRDSVEGLWDWIEPNCPEDLSFLRANDGSPWFASIAHEREAFFKLSQVEKSAVESIFGSNSLVFQFYDQYPEEVY
jgi:hypothetical protein